MSYRFGLPRRPGRTWERVQCDECRVPAWGRGDWQSFEMKIVVDRRNWAYLCGDCRRRASTEGGVKSLTGKACPSPDGYVPC